MADFFDMNLLKAVLRMATPLLFAAMGGLNLWIAYHFDTDTWVNFKMFGGLGLMLLFILVQAVYMSRFMQEKPQDPQ